MAHLPKGQGLIPLPPFKAWLASNIPAVYDNTMSYYEELVALIKYLQDTVVPAVNTNAETITILSNAIEQLQQYVDTYFENLDVQTEINNKLDAMAQSGELAEIIAQYAKIGAVYGFDTINDMSISENISEGSICKVLGIDNYEKGDGSFYKIRKITSSDIIDGLNIVKIFDNSLIAERIENPFSKSKLNLKFYKLSANGDFSLLHYENEEKNVNIIIDFGNNSDFQNVSEKMLSAGITEINYAFISHYHNDHVGMLNNFLNDSRFDFEKCIFYLPPTPDYSQFVGSSRYIPEEEENVKNILNSKNIQFIIPNNSTKIEISNDLKIEFLNCDTTKFSNYYPVTIHYSDVNMDCTDYNNFSMCLLITHNFNKILFTGDIQKEAEDVIIEQGLPICNLIKAPHHNINPISKTSEKFIYNYFKPDYVVAISDQIFDVIGNNLSKNYKTINTSFSGDSEVESNGFSYTAKTANGLFDNKINFALYAQAKNTKNVLNIGPSIAEYRINEGDDLNSFTIAGTYCAENGSIVPTIDNSPYTDEIAFKLVVINIVSDNRVIQYLFKNQSSIVYYRYGSITEGSTTWSYWSSYLSLGEAEKLSKNSDLNNIQMFGCYASSDSSTTATITNKPSEVTTAFKLIVECLTNRQDRIRQIIYTNTPQPNIYVRNFTGTWGSWYKLNMSVAE